MIEALLSVEDRRLLKELAGKIDPPNCYLEIGVWKGGSIDIVLPELKKGVEAWGVDIEDINEIEDPRFHFLYGKAKDFAPTFSRPIGLLFLDGVHQDIHQDFLDWEHCLVPGSYVVFHDGDCQEPLFDSPNYTVIRHSDASSNSAMFIVCHK
jgi:hypothetical protein